MAGISVRFAPNFGESQDSRNPPPPLHLLQKLQLLVLTKYGGRHLFRRVKIQHILLPAVSKVANPELQDGLEANLCDSQSLAI